MTAEGRSALAGWCALFVMTGAIAGQVFALAGLFDAAKGSDLAAVAVALGLLPLVAFNVWLFVRLAGWLDRLFGARR